MNTRCTTAWDLLGQALTLAAARIDQEMQEMESGSISKTRHK
jgi:hypothetical protein